MSLLGRSDFIGGIDNDALDFDQLDAFIHGHTPSTTTQNVSVATAGGNNHLPESPPDSGSEPPYSPSDLHGMTLVQPSNTHASAQDFHHPGSTTTDMSLPQHFMADNGMYLNGNGGTTTDQPTTQTNGGGGTSEDKRDAMLSKSSMQTTDNQFMLHQQGSVTLIELGQNRTFKSDMLDINASPRGGADRELHSDELMSLIPNVYAANVGGGTQNGNQLGMRPNTLPSVGRKRKASQSNIGQPPAVIKPEPGKSENSVFIFILILSFIHKNLH